MLFHSCDTCHITICLPHPQIYFTDGVYLDTETLVSVAKEFGFDAEKTRKYITDPDNLDRLAAKARVWRTKEVKGENTLTIKARIWQI